MEDDEFGWVVREEVLEGSSVEMFGEQVGNFFIFILEVIFYVIVQILELVRLVVGVIVR